MLIQIKYMNVSVHTVSDKTGRGKTHVQYDVHNLHHRFIFEVWRLQTTLTEMIKND